MLADIIQSSEELQRLPQFQNVHIWDCTVVWSKELGLLWNSLSLQGWCYRHQWRAAPVQLWMDNSGSCTVLGSCLYKECHAAGITDRSWFSWRASVLEGQIIRVNKSQDSCFADLKAPRYIQQETYGTLDGVAFTDGGIVIGSFICAEFSGSHNDQSLCKLRRKRLLCLSTSNVMWCLTHGCLLHNLKFCFF